MGIRAPCGDHSLVCGDHSLVCGDHSLVCGDHSPLWGSQPSVGITALCVGGLTHPTLCSCTLLDISFRGQFIFHFTLSLHAHPLAQVGLLLLPHDGNPHNSQSLIAHPTGVRISLSCSVYSTAGVLCMRGKMCNYYSGTSLKSRLTQDIRKCPY